MKKVLIGFVIIGLLLTLTLGCSAKKTEQSSVKHLVVGMELAYPPFETKDQQGNPSGVSMDLAKALGAYLNRPVEIVNTNWDGLIPSLQTGKVDVVISSMTITEERGKVVDFSIPYARSYLAVLVNKNSGITSVEDLNVLGRVVAVKKGTTGNIYANTHLTNATVHALSSENATVIEVIQGKSDAFIYDQLTIYRQNQEHKATTDALLIPFQDSESWGMAVKKGESELLAQINAFITKFRNDGGFNTLTQAHLPEEKKIFDSLGFPWFFD